MKKISAPPASNLLKVHRSTRIGLKTAHPLRFFSSAGAFICFVIGWKWLSLTQRLLVFGYEAWVKRVRQAKTAGSASPTGLAIGLILKANMLKYIQFHSLLKNYYSQWKKKYMYCYVWGLDLNILFPICVI